MAVEPDGEREAPEQEQADAGETGEEFDRDQLFHLLQNERRRRALDYLRGKEGSVRMRDIVDHVAAAEHDTTPEALRSDERKRVHIALYQSHLPKLDQAGVLEYDKDRGIVTRTDRAAELDRFLAVDAMADGEPAPADDAVGYPGGSASGDIRTTEAGWHRYYLALAVLGLASIAAAVAAGTAVVTPPTVAVAVTVAFVALATIHWLRESGRV